VCQVLAIAHPRFPDQQSVTSAGTIFRVIRFIRFLLVSISTTATLLVLVLVVRAFDSRGVLDLNPEYRIEFEKEFQAGDKDETDWPRYLEIEHELAIELRSHIDPDARPNSVLDRYSDDSLTYPGSFDGNWNYSYELKPARPSGVAVMLHGLTDSPYSMLPTAQTAVGAGYNVVVPRMPGHGFAVSGLLHANWEDWMAAVRVAVRHSESLRQAGEPFLLDGYSNGALLALNYALRCADYDDMPCPDRIIMLSPAIAISKAARFANWHATLSWMPYYEKLKWLSLLPEIDPFKFTSFPNRAASEIYKLGKRTYRRLDDPEQVAELPPILAFQSVVDNTVSAAAVVSALFDRLPDNGSALTVYDVNRNSTVVHLMKKSPPDLLDYFVGKAPLNYDLTILRNSASDLEDIVAATLTSGTAETVYAATDLAWPAGVYSLSHVALPFPPFDAVYGEGKSGGRAGVVLGSMLARGEPGLLSLTPAYFLRLRNNPFFSYQARQIHNWLILEK